MHSYPSPFVVLLVALCEHGMDFTVQGLGLVATEVRLVP